MVGENMTLNELCQTFHVSRRAVQGYELHGLLKPSGRNEKGHLLYNKTAQEKVCLIKQYQDFGFTVRQIADLLEASQPVLKQCLISQRERMLKDKTSLEENIQRITELIAKAG